jgi:hypothetical protein
MARPPAGGKCAMAGVVSGREIRMTKFEASNE